MKKIYMLLAGVALVGMMNAETPEIVVLVDTDFSELRSQVVLGHQDQRNAADALPINGGTMYWRGPRYNDTSSKPTINIEGTDTQLQPENLDVNYMRFGSNVILTDGVPTNHFIVITPNNPFKNGGKITFTISINDILTAGTFDIYDIAQATLLGTFDIPTTTPRREYSEISFDLPSNLNGIKTIGIGRTGTNSSPFVWNLKIESEDISSSIAIPSINANISTVEYYNISGSNVGSDWNALPAGIYVSKTTYDNGSVVTEKVSKARK